MKYPGEEVSVTGIILKTGSEIKKTGVNLISA